MLKINSTLFFDSISMHDEAFLLRKLPTYNVESLVEKLCFHDTVTVVKFKNFEIGFSFASFPSVLFLELKTVKFVELFFKFS